MTSAVREERKVLTAVFADVVGSTALAERLDPEDVKLIVGEAVARIVGEVESLGGHVKDLAGDGVLAFFGAPTTREDDAERAVRCALRIVGEMEEYADEVRRGWGAEGFGVRVGAATGAVVVGEVGAGSRVEYAAFGDTVNVAARLQSAAEPGTVLVDDATHHAVEGLFEWGERLELELKGKGESVAAWPVAGLAAEGRPQRGLPGVETRLVGRSRELGQGRETLEALGAGRGGILIVAGDAGIGKSRLLDELRELAEREGSLWLEGRCVSYGESLPYWPFRDLLRGEWIGAGADEPELRIRVGLRRRLEQLFGDGASELYPYLGGLLEVSLEHEAAARTAQLSPEALQWRTFEVVGQLFARLTEDAPLVIAIDDLHWADPTSVLLLEQLLSLAEEAPVLLVLSLRPERDHAAWGLREHASREFPHLLRELDLGPLGDADGELLAALVAPATLPAELERRVLEAADGNPFFLEELVRSLADVGALARTDEGWRFDHAVEVEVPPTVEKAILARLDRLSPPARDLVTSASALGRTFPLPLLEGVLDEPPSTPQASGSSGRASSAVPTTLAATDALHELQRLGLLRQSRRWPQPEYGFRHALIQETAYRTLLGDQRTRLHRRAAEWLEARYSGRDAEVLGLLAYHWLRADDADKAAGYLLRAGDKAREEHALDEAIEHYRDLLPLLERRGERQEISLVLFKLALALHTSLRFAEANETYRRAFEHWTPSEAAPGPPTEALRMAVSYVPQLNDPTHAGWWPDIELCMQLFDRLVEAWPERTIVPALAERWEISDDGLRYVFHLREGLTWSDGAPLTAHDVEFGIKRVLDPQSPGASVAVYFVLEGGQDYALGRSSDAGSIGVRALDDRTVEFRLVAPAPYFMSVVNRPDAAPQPRHAIEQYGAAWSAPEHQIVSGPLRVAEHAPERLVLARHEGYHGFRRGNVAEIECIRSSVDDAYPAFGRGELDLARVVYTPHTADHVHWEVGGDEPLTWLAYIGFDHTRAELDVELRRALALAIDRSAVAEAAPANLAAATGGIVPPALYGHSPDIAPKLDLERAREHLSRSGAGGAVTLALTAQDVWSELLEIVVRGWRDGLGIDVRLELWPGHDPPAGSLLEHAPMALFGWMPGYPDPEYMLRLLLHSEARTNAVHFADDRFDELVEAARQERNDRARLERYHDADRHAVADRVAVIPFVYGRSTALVQPHVHGWWEFAKSSANFADLLVERPFDP